MKARNTSPVPLGGTKPSVSIDEPLSVKSSEIEPAPTPQYISVYPQMTSSTQTPGSRMSETGA